MPDCSNIASDKADVTLSCDLTSTCELIDSLLICFTSEDSSPPTSTEVFLDVLTVEYSEKIFTN